MEKGKYPSRFMNDQRGILGLWASDFVAALCLFCLWAKVFEETPLALLGVPLAILSLVLIAPIRLTTRRKIVRDTVGYYLSGKRLYDPKISRTR